MLLTRQSRPGNGGSRKRFFDSSSGSFFFFFLPLRFDTLSRVYPLNDGSDQSRLEVDDAFARRRQALKTNTILYYRIASHRTNFEDLKLERGNGSLLKIFKISRKNILFDGRNEEYQSIDLVPCFYELFPRQRDRDRFPRLAQGRERSQRFRGDAFDTFY